MKKIVLTLALILCLFKFSFSMTRDERLNLITKIQNDTQQITRQNRIENSISIILLTGVTIWGFDQKSAYGTVTGSIFAFKIFAKIFEW